MSCSVQWNGVWGLGLYLFVLISQVVFMFRSQDGAKLHL